MYAHFNTLTKTVADCNSEFQVLRNDQAGIKLQLDTMKRDVFGDITSSVRKVARQFADMQPASNSGGGNNAVADPEVMRILQMKANQTELDSLANLKANK